MSARPCGCDPENLPKPYHCEAFPECYFGREVAALGVGRRESRTSDMPAIFDCGCSRLKVAAGMCDIYGPDGRPRA